MTTGPARSPDPTDRSGPADRQQDHFPHVPEDGTPLDLVRARALYGR
ncbi:hypothetical protein ACIOMM_18375 [Streptomyces sp. NPDC087908]